MIAAVIARLFTLSPLRALVWVAALSAAFALWRVLVFRHLSALGPEGIRLRVRLPPEELNQLGFARAFRRGATPRETMMVLTPYAVHFAAGKDYVSQIASDKCEMSVEVDDRQPVNSVRFAFKERSFTFDRNAIGTQLPIGEGAIEWTVGASCANGQPYLHWVFADSLEEADRFVASEVLPLMREEGCLAPESIGHFAVADVDWAIERGQDKAIPTVSKALHAAGAATFGQAIEDLCAITSGKLDSSVDTTRSIDSARESWEWDDSLTQLGRFTSSLCSTRGSWQQLLHGALRSQLCNSQPNWH